MVRRISSIDSMNELLALRAVMFAVCHRLGTGEGHQPGTMAEGCTKGILRREGEQDFTHWAKFNLREKWKLKRRLQPKNVTPSGWSLVLWLQWLQPPLWIQFFFFNVHHDRHDHIFHPHLTEIVPIDASLTRHFTIPASLCIYIYRYICITDFVWYCFQIHLMTHDKLRNLFTACSQIKGTQWEQKDVTRSGATSQEGNDNQEALGWHTIEVHLASFQFSGCRKIEFHGKVAGCKLRIPIGADQIG